MADEPDIFNEEDDVDIDDLVIETSTIKTIYVPKGASKGTIPTKPTPELPPKQIIETAHQNPPALPPKHHPNAVTPTSSKGTLPTPNQTQSQPQTLNSNASNPPQTPTHLTTTIQHSNAVTPTSSKGSLPAPPIILVENNINLNTLTPTSSKGTIPSKPSSPTPTQTQIPTLTSTTIAPPPKILLPNASVDENHSVFGFRPSTVNAILNNLLNLKYNVQNNGAGSDEIRKQLNWIFDVMSEDGKTISDKKQYNEQQLILLQNESKNFLKRRKRLKQMHSALKEILETERNYVRILSLVNSTFQIPLLRETNSQQQGSTNNMQLDITQKEVQTVFGNLSELSDLHNNILRDLERIFAKIKPSTFSSSTTNQQESKLYYSPYVLARTACAISICFDKYIEKLRSTYCKYAANCQRALDTIAILKQRKSFRAWWTTVHQDSSLNQLKLDDYLLNPIKRLPLYGLLMGAISKQLDPSKCSADETAQEWLKATTKSIMEVADQMNKAKEISELEDKVIDLEKSLDGNFPAFAKPGRYFLYKSELNVVSGERHERLRVHLLNDMMVLTSLPSSTPLANAAPSAMGSIIVGVSSKESKYVDKIDLNGAKLESLADNELMRHRFKVSSKQNDQITMFVCDNAGEKERWLKSFQKVSNVLEIDQSVSNFLEMQIQRTHSNSFLVVGDSSKRTSDHSTRTSSVSEGSFVVDGTQTPNAHLSLNSGVGSGGVTKQERSKSSLPDYSTHQQQQQQSNSQNSTPASSKEQIPNNNNNNGAISGFLMKQAKLRKMFVKRWFVLESDGTMYFYKGSAVEKREKELQQHEKDKQEKEGGEQKPSKSIQKAFRKTMTSTKKLLDQINPATKQHKETKEIERDEEDFQDLSALPLPKSIYLQKYRLLTYPVELENWTFVLESDTNANFIIQALNKEDFLKWKTAMERFTMKSSASTVSGPVIISSNAAQNLHRNRNMTLQNNALQNTKSTLLAPFVKKDADLPQ